MPDKIKEFYNTIKSDGIFKDENEFRSYVNKDPNQVYQVLESIDGTKGVFQNTDELSNYFGLKKKDNANPTESSGTAGSTVGKYVKEGITQDTFGFKSNKPLVAQVPLTSAEKVRIGIDARNMTNNVSKYTKVDTPNQPQIASLKKPVIDINESVENSMAQKEEVAYQKEQEDIKQAKIEEMGAGKAAWERTTSALSRLGKNLIDGTVAASSEQVAILSKSIDDGLGFFTGDKSKPIDEYATYQFAKAVESFTGKAFNPNELFEGEIQDQVASTTGDMLGLVASAFITRNPTSALSKLGTKGIVKALAGSAAARKEVSKMMLKEGVKSLTKPTTFLGAAQVGVRNYDEAISKGATEDQANSMYWSTAVSGGLLNSLPIGNLLNRFDKASGGKMKQVVAGGLVGGVEEAVTEGLEQITTNFAAKNIYDETRTLLDGMGESVGMGGGIGFVFNAFGVSLGKARHKFKNNPEKISEIDASEQYLKELIEKTAVQSIPVPKELQVKVDKYNKVLNNPNSPQALKDIANNSLLEIQSGLVGSKEMEVSGITNLSDDARAEYSIIDAEIKELEAAREDIDDVELKDRVDESLSELKQKQSELLTNAQQPQSEGGLGVSSVAVEEQSQGQLDSGGSNTPDNNDVSPPIIPPNNGTQSSTNPPTEPPNNTPANNGNLPPTVPPPPTNSELSTGMEPIESNNDESSATEVDTKRELSDREKQMLTKPEGRSFGRMQVLDKISEKLMAVPAISKTVKMFTTGNKDAVRSKEIVDAEIGITMDKIKSIKNKLSNTIGKSAANRKLANDVISVGNIDDTISKLAYSDSYQALSDIMEGKYTPAEIKAATESFNANNKEGISAIDKAKFEAIVADVSKISPSQIVDKRTSDSAEIKSLAGKIINFDTVGKVKKDNTPSPTVVIGGQSALFPGKATYVASKVSPDTNNSELKTSKDKVETLEDLRGQLLSKPRGEEILNAIYEAIKTKESAVEELSKSPLGKKILNASNDARELIDAHQEYLLDSEAAKKIQERLGDTIAGNQGTYLKRTFQMFKDKKYEPSVAQKERAVQSIIDDMMVNELLNLQKSKEYQKTIKAKEAETTKSTEVSTSVDDSPDIGSGAVEVDLNGNEITTTNNESNDVTVEDYRKWSSGREIGDVDFYRAEYLKQLYESVERKARIELDTYLDDIRRRKESGPLHQLSQGVQKIDGNSLEMRKVFDASFVDLLGNVNDPISQFMDTVMAQAQIKAAADLHFMINSVAGVDMIFDSKENLIDLRGNTKGFKEINDKNSLLGGKWVSEDIHDVISSEGGLDIDTWLGGVYKTVLSKMRKTKTIYNPAGWTTNWMGGAITHLANGIVTNPVSFAKNMANRVNYIANQKTLNKSYDDDIQAMKDNGAWSTSVSAETIRILEDKLASMEAYDSFGSSKAKAVINKGKIIDDNIIRNYSVIDDYTKLVFFREKKDIFARKSTGKKYADLTKEEKRQVDSNLSERIKQNIATTSRLPRFYREITKLPFGDFMAFRISAIASGKNTILNASSDLKYAFDKTKSKEQRKAYLEDSFKTTTGFVLSAALNASIYGSIATCAMGLLDDKDEDLFLNKQYNGEDIGSKSDIYIDFKGTPAVNAQWMRGKNNIPIKDDGNGNLELVNLSNKDPNDELYGLFVPRAGTTYTETLMGIAQEVAAPNMAVKLFDSILKGTDQWGRDIYSTDDTFLEKRSKQVAYIMTEALLPPSIKNVHKQAISDVVQSKLKKEDISKDEIKDTDIGATEYIGSVIKNSPKLLNRTYDLNISEQLGYYAKEFYESTPEKFTDLSPEKKRNRIENLKPIREGYLYIQKYSRLHDNPAFLRKATENLFKKSRGITDQEKKYIRTGKLPKFEKNVTNNEIFD